MASTEDNKDDQIVGAQLGNWDRSLIVISIPHASAYGAFIGNNEILTDASQSPDSFYGILALLFITPVTTIWLFFVHDQLRNTFLRVGHMGKFQTVKHNIFYAIVTFVPVFIIFLAVYLRRYVDEKSFILIGTTMISWGVCAVIVSGNIYLKIAKTLRIKTGD